MAFIADGQWLLAGPGTFVYGPRDVVHGFQVISEARMLIFCTPAGFERFIADLATPIDAPLTEPNMQRMMELAARHEIEIDPLDPLLGDILRRADPVFDRSRELGIKSFDRASPDVRTVRIGHRLPEKIFGPLREKVVQPDAEPVDTDRQTIDRIEHETQ